MSKRVLIFVDRMRTGGIQKLLLDLCEAFDRDRIEPEFLLLDDGEEYPMENQLRSCAKVYKLDNVWLRKPQDFITYKKAVDKFFDEHSDYAAVHMNSGPKNYYLLKSAQKHGIPVRIAHSHNTGFQTKSSIQIFIGNWCKLPLRKYANVYLGCSDMAIKWMFGEKNKAADNAEFLKNGVNLDLFEYNPAKRDSMRESLGIGNEIVIGNVGRFVNQKNHTKLIDIFYEIHKLNENTVLLLAGIGELMDSMKEKTERLGLEKSVKFLGFRTDVGDLLQAFDLFLMPSLYEGFPVTGVEAQASGLPCVFSDTITRDARLLDEVAYISLNESAEVWARKGLALVGRMDRGMAKTMLKEDGFDIKDMARRLEDIYINDKN